MLKWTSGRQNTGYEKITFIEKGFSLGKFLGFDLHLIRYPSGSFILKHVDKVDFGKHYRFNFVLKRPKSGGIFECEKLWQVGQRFFFFRPDLHEHSVSKCEGTRYVLSFGFITKD